MGSYADVLLFKWSSQTVAVKRLILNPRGEQISALKFETSLAISLLHPNVVRVFGTVRMDGGLVGIVMEHADGGALADRIPTLNDGQRQQVGHTFRSRYRSELLQRSHNW